MEKQTEKSVCFFAQKERTIFYQRIKTFWKDGQRTDEKGRNLTPSCFSNGAKCGIIFVEIETNL